jgi:hypothetical protein
MMRGRRRGAKTKPISVEDDERKLAETKNKPVSANDYVRKTLAVIPW